MITINIFTSRRMNLWHLWNLWEILFAPAVNRQPPLQEGLSSQRNLLHRQHLIPLLRTVNLGILIRDKDDSLRRDAALVIRNPRCLAIRTLRFLDCHAHRHADIDVQLLSGRILQMQQLAFPDGVAAVQLTSLLQRLLHILRIIHIHRGLKQETFRISIPLRTVVVKKSRIVNGSERQLFLQFLPSLRQRLLILLIRCLRSTLSILSIQASYRFLATNLLYQPLQPRLGYQLVVHRQGLGRVDSSHVALACRVQCHYLYSSHAMSSLNFLTLPLISSTSL